MEQGGELDYLIEITTDILGRKDDEGPPMRAYILDAAGSRELVNGLVNQLLTAIAIVTHHWVSICRYISA